MLLNLLFSPLGYILEWWWGGLWLPLATLPSTQSWKGILGTWPASILQVLWHVSQAKAPPWWCCSLFFCQNIYPLCEGTGSFKESLFTQTALEFIATTSHAVPPELCLTVQPNDRSHPYTSSLDCSSSVHLKTTLLTGISRKSLSPCRSWIDRSLTTESSRIFLGLTMKRTLPDSPLRKKTLEKYFLLFLLLIANF